MNNNSASNGQPQPGNGAGNGGNGKSNVPAVVQKREKMPGGITGKGFKPGQTGNPHGARLGRQREQFAFGAYLREWLQEVGVVKDDEGNPTKKEPRLKTIINRLAKDKPEVLLHYAYGKPVEVHEVQAAEGTELEFIVRVNGKDVP